MLRALVSCSFPRLFVVCCGWLTDMTTPTVELQFRARDTIDSVSFHYQLELYYYFFSYMQAVA